MSNANDPIVIVSAARTPMGGFQGDFNALTAAHGVIIPLECEFFAMRGVALLVETIDKVTDRLNPRLQIDGILATMYDGRTLHSREVVRSVVDHFQDRVFHTVISRTVRSSARPAPSTRLCCAENAVKWRLSTVLLPKSWFSPLSSVRPSKAGGSFSRTAARA